MIIAIIQARMSSTRLPGKVLKKICGKPMLQHQIERVLRSTKIDQLVVATSLDETDEPIEKFCSTINVDCFRGSLDDVLDRYYQVAKKYKPTHVIRLTGDCPLTDPMVLDNMINYYLSDGYDYVCNTQVATYPDGLDAWIFSYKLLVNAWKNARLPSEREHVTMYFKNNSDKFKLGSLEYKEDLSSLRWTVDELEDLELLTILFNELYKKNKIFEMADVLSLLEKRPELKTYNTQFIRDQGLLNSLEEDKKYIKPS